MVTQLSPFKQVKAVYYNDTPIANMALYLFEGQSWIKELIQNLTTNSEGIAEFTLCTTDHGDIINLEVREKTLTCVTALCLAEPFGSCSGVSSLLMQVSTSPTREYPRYRTSRIENGDHSMSLAQEASSETKTRSSFKFVSHDEPLRCGKEEEVIVKYTIVGETPGTLELMYIVSNEKTRPRILMKPQEE